MSPEKRVKIAAEFLRAAHHADHVYEERIEQYRRMIVGEEESSDWAFARRALL
jgi:hypothetical protein